MRRRTPAVIAVVLLAAAAAHGQMQTPPGCSPARAASAAADGWANYVVHAKTGIELVRVPAGRFTMGATGASSAAEPPHQVTIALPFYIGRTEVTNAQYRRFVDATGYDGKPDTDPAYDLYLRHWRGQGLMSTADEYPVVWVSWLNANAFCHWAGLALPTEAEWEYACRAGTATTYYNGDDPKGFDAIGWALANSNALTQPIGQKQPNAWGLHDLLGNVWEWCEDDYVWRYDGAPADGSARIGNPRAMTRLLRGGSWSNASWPVVCGSASRFNSAPGNASNDVGFRVVLGRTGGRPR